MRFCRWTPKFSSAEEIEAAEAEASRQGQPENEESGSNSGEEQSSRQPADYDLAEERKIQERDADDYELGDLIGIGTASKILC